MSTQYWVNQIGAASAATTPAGSVPAYGLALDAGTAPFTQEQFNAWLEDEIRRTRAAEIAAVQARREAESQEVATFYKFLGGAMDAAVQGVGFIAGGPFQELDRDEMRDRGQGVIDTVLDAELPSPGPGGVSLRDAGQDYMAAYNWVSRFAEAPLLMNRNAEMFSPESGFWNGYDLRMWFDPSEWGKAWREADDRTFGEAVVDNLVVSQDTTVEDLERQRRTSSLYAMTAFGAELWGAMKFDPSVLAGKGVGEFRRIKQGTLPQGRPNRETTVQQQAQQVLHAETMDDALAYRYRGFNPAGHYGAWRGRHAVQNLPELRTKRQELTFAEFADLELFRRGVNGPAAASMFWHALDEGADPALLDLTRRAVYGDTAAWHEIRTLQNTVPDEVLAYAPQTPEKTRPLLDAIDTMKGRYARLEKEAADLEEKVRKREQIQPLLDSEGKLNSGFFNYHTWELDRDLDQAMLELADMDRVLASYGDGYTTWLRQADPGSAMDPTDLVSTRARTGKVHGAYQSTWISDSNGKAHTIMGIPRAFFVREANPISLNRVDSGVQSIRRQFDQYAHLTGYRNPAALNDIIYRYTHAADETTRRDIAREVELVHGVPALAQKFGLSTETVDKFLRHSRNRVDDMFNRLLSGNDQIYSSAPGDLRRIDVLDGNQKKVSYRLPVDVTQLANWYMPMDFRRVYLEIKRRPDVFEEIDTAFRNGFRGTAGRTMNSIDAVGTFWNSIWKPAQLFRLAWPQRVLLDESFRGMSLLGMSVATQQLSAGGHALYNGFNPAQHPAAFGGLAGTLAGGFTAGPLGAAVGGSAGALAGKSLQAVSRRRIKVGPGPLSEEALGLHGTRAHQEEVEAAPFVPEYFAPVRDKKRAEELSWFIGENAMWRARRFKAMALMRDPNPTKSLPGFMGREIDRGYRQQWADIDDAIYGRDMVVVDPVTRELRPATAPDYEEKLPGEDFSFGDLLLAKDPDLDLDAELTGDRAGHHWLIERFLLASPSTQRQLWEGHYMGQDFWPVRHLFAPAGRYAQVRDADDPTASVRLPDGTPDEQVPASDFDLIERPEGALREQIRELVKGGKAEFDANLRHRQTGAGHGPLFSGEFNMFRTRPAKRELLTAKALGAKWAPMDAMLSQNFSGRRLDLADVDLYGSDSQLFRRLVAIREREGGTRLPATVMFDPISGRTTNSGYAVRVKTIELGSLHRVRENNASLLPMDLVDKVEAFVGGNADLLSSKNYRLLLESHGDTSTLSVVRHFGTSKNVKGADAQRRAAEFAHWVKADSFYAFRRPSSTTRTRTGNPVEDSGSGAEIYVREADNISPFMEGTLRYFTQHEEIEFTPGKAPIEGEPAAYHATIPGRPLPTDAEGNVQLLPRDEVETARGNYVGKGLYTTLSLETVRDGYANGDPTLMYTVRGAKDGKRYKVFDVETPISREDADNLLAAMRSYYDNARLPEHLDPAIFLDELDYALNEIHQAESWLRLLSALEGWNVGPNTPGFRQPQDLVTQYLVDTYDAGALTHTGGRLIGGFGDHQVFVWLFPEELIIKPVYDRTGRYYHLEEWLSSRSALERMPQSPVPQNRIVRRGKRDPKFAELEKIHRKVEQRKAVLAKHAENVEKAVGGNHLMAQAARENRYWNDPVFQELRGQEVELMRQLGLEWTENVQLASRYADPADDFHWYTQTNPAKPGETRQQEALRANAGATSDLGTGEMAGLDIDVPSLGDILNSGWNHVHEQFLRKLYKRHQFGAGSATFTTLDKQKQVTADIFEDVGINFIPLISSSPAFQRLTDSYERTLSMYRKRAAGHRMLAPPDLGPEALRTLKGQRLAREYFNEWSDLLNTQVRNSPIWHRMLRGESDEQIIDWLEGTHEGRLVRERIKHRSHNPERWVEEHRERLNYYLPDENLQRILADEQLRPSDLQRVDRDMLPNVYGPDLEMVRGDIGWGSVFGTLVDKTYNALGTVPTDLLVRQPFARANYNLKMRNLIGSVNKDTITNEDIRAFERISREFALRQVKRTLFDLSDESNFTQAVRFLSPFWGAQQEALMKWGRIAVDRPETVARFYIGQEQVYGLFQAIDEEGKPVEDKNHWSYNPNHRILIQIPNNLKKVPFFAKALEAFGSVGIGIGAMNTALQGDWPLVPGVGPLVAIPADWYLDNFTKDMGVKYSENDLMRWIFPVGRPAEGAGRFLDQSLPGWLRRVQQFMEGEGNRTYANTYYTVAREMILDHKRRGLPAPSPEEIQEAAKQHYYLRIVASFGMPFPMEWRPNNQFYLDEYHKIQQLYGPGEGFEKFVQKYGADYARYATSSSQSVGVPPTMAGMAEWEKVSDLVGGKYGEYWGSAMISPNAWEDEFSSAAYDTQFEVRLSPGSDERLRESVSPNERLDQTEIRLGWLEFRKIDAMINAELWARGLTSTEQSGAQDIHAVKQAMIRELELEKPSWSVDYRSFEDTIYERVRQLREWAFDPRFDNRPDIQGVRQYLAIRDQATQSLDWWAGQGGSRSLQTEENTQLRQWYYTQVGALTQANPAFGEFYSRYLSQDRLVRGSGP